jgi:hypothetical protein
MSDSRSKPNIGHVPLTVAAVAPKKTGSYTLLFAPIAASRIITHIDSKCDIAELSEINFNPH